MSVTIHCIRHGQGLHNVPPGFYQLPDPNMTTKGEAQCIALREMLFPNQSHISLVASSPMARAIQSAALIFEPTLRSSKDPRRILALPDAQETSHDPCDIGSDVEVLQQKCREYGWPVDISLVKDGWNIKYPGTRYSASSAAISRRARDMRIFLRQQARDLIARGERDVHIALVAHGGFMHYFTGDWEGAEKFPGTGWVNCETRAYTFTLGVASDADQDAHIDELIDSRRRRGLNHAMLTHWEMQARLYEQAMQSWEDQGLQNHSKVDDNELRN